ncbi:MAG: hypothetical protein J5855_06160, partial [Mailhella sp.]|nr:hypothetical protein [Mailhella sp.]
AKKNNIDIKSLLGMGDTPPAEVQKGNPGEAPLHVTDMSKAGNSVSGVLEGSGSDSETKSDPGLGNGSGSAAKPEQSDDAVPPKPEQKDADTEAQIGKQEASSGSDGAASPAILANAAGNGQKQPAAAGIETNAEENTINAASAPGTAQGGTSAGNNAASPKAPVQEASGNKSGQTGQKTGKSSERNAVADADNGGGNSPSGNEGISTAPAADIAAVPGEVVLVAPEGTAPVVFDDDKAKKKHQKALAAVNAAQENSGNAVAGGASAGGTLTGNVETAEAQDEQPIVTDKFVADLSKYLVKNYRPGTKGGIIRVSPVSANQHYGTTLSGLEHGAPDAMRGRSFILKYTFKPAVIKTLTALYKELLCASMRADAEKNGLTESQTAEMFRLYANQLVPVASVLDSLASKPGIQNTVRKLLKEEEQLDQARLEFADAVIDLERADSAGSGMPRESNARLNALSNAISDREKQVNTVRNALVAEIRQGAASRADSETAVYVAKWIARRGADEAATRAAAESVRTFAAAFSAAAAGN